MAVTTPRNRETFSNRYEPITMKASGKIPFLLGFALFISSFGFAAPLPMPWHFQALLAPMIIGAAFVLVIRDQKIGDVKIDAFILLFVTWVVVSLGWTLGSTRNSASIALLLLSATSVCLLTSSLVDVGAMLRWLSKATMVMAVAALLHAAASPGVAFSPAPGEVDGRGLRSFYDAKNSLGQTLIYAVALRLVIGPGRWRLAANALLAVLLVLCNNSGAIIAVVCLVGAQQLAMWAVRERSSGGRGGLFVVGGAMTFGLVALIAGRNMLYSAIGRGADLTGRDKIWKYTLEMALERPWIGSGVGGFWIYGIGPAEYVRRSSGWAVTSGHQGWLDVFVDYGFVGFLLMFLIVGLTISRILRRLSNGDAGQVTLVSLGIVVGLLVGSLAESTLVFPGLPLLAFVNGIMYNEPIGTRPDAPVKAAVGPTGRARFKTAVSR